MEMPERMELLFLHALPLDGSMWSGQRQILPDVTHAPTLYGCGESLGEWARAAIAPLTEDRLIVVGCSVGGSCALEIAALIPERIAALVLIGTKARRRPDPTFKAEALEALRTGGIEQSWTQYWAPLFSGKTDPATIAAARMSALNLKTADVARGVAAFHSRESRDDVLSTLDCPIIVVTGADDVAPGVTTSREQAQSAKWGRLHVVADCGHYVPLEQPEHLNTILKDLIAELGK
jgi:pimeloyl-ACP methyl ester carboxylesterase